MSVAHGLLGGRYRLEVLIGRGGMASVWRATDIMLDRDVAVKRLHARFLDDPELAERFRREGLAVARLSHPNLVRLLDQGLDGDEPFLVFELVDGHDLKTLIRRDGRLAPADAAAICAQVARALGAAHAAGVVHRDIKSHNVMVTRDGVAKLTDFGIARIVEEGTATLTRTGIIMGSSDYLAPEQAEGRDVDERGDVYSLGVVLFEALTGRLPFQGDNAVAVATKHVYENAPDPRTFAPDVPRDIAAACLRALAKRPRDRFPSADAFGDALEGRGVTGPTLGHDSTTGRIRTRRPRRRGRVPVALAVVAVAAGGLAAWQTGLVGDGGNAASGADTTLAFALQDHDPFGLFISMENPQDVPLAVDGDRDTAWTTELYNSASLGGIKPGVGLLATLDPTARVTSVRISSGTPGGRVQILGPGSDAPGGREVLGEGSLADGDLDIAVTAVDPVSEILIWFTELPETATPGRYQASVGEVEVRGVANT